MHPPSDNLRLTNRHGLAAEMAYLRDSYPQAEWHAHAHANYGELSAFWLQVHASLRTQGRALQDITLAFRSDNESATVFQQRFVPQLNQYLQPPEGHHHIEDALYFPRFRQLDKRMVAGFDLLENDHHIIHDSVIRTADQHAAAADELLVLLDRHLDDEEDLVIPAMLEHGERPLT